MVNENLFSNIQAYQAFPARYFSPERIILTKGWDANDEQIVRAKTICSAYPQADVLERSDIPHNRVMMDDPDLLTSHYQGKKTLVLGVHKSALRHSQEDQNTCPNYWHFSPYGFCPYDCKYCYLAGTPGVKFSPTVKIFLNLEDILTQIEKTARNLTEPTPFYLGKLQDALALDSLTGYSRIMIPFFARQKYARMTLLTKASHVGNLLDLDHNYHTILSWSMNPPVISEQFETNVPSIAERLAAMGQCVKAGYPVRVVIMPIIPINDWVGVYQSFIEQLLSTVRPERITLGQICSYSTALQLTQRKLGKENKISSQLQKDKSGDGRMRFPHKLRVDIYRQLIQYIKKIDPEIQIGLCLEEHHIFQTLQMDSSIGKCNCVL